MQWVILAGVLLYALIVYFVLCLCRAAGTFERFYERLMDLENDESPAQGGAPIGEQASIVRAARTDNDFEVRRPGPVEHGRHGGSREVE